MPLEMKFVETHLLMEVIASKLVLKTEQVYCRLDDFNCDCNFENYLAYLLLYIQEKVLEMENYYTVSPLQKEFSFLIFYCLSLWWKLI